MKASWSLLHEGDSILRKAHLRIVMFLALVAVGAAVLVFAGTPYLSFSHALASVSADGYYDHGEHHEPGIPEVCHGSDVSGAVQQTVTATTSIYWGPNEGDKIESLTVQQGQTYWVVGTDETGQWSKLVIACETVWVPSGALGG